MGRVPATRIGRAAAALLLLLAAAVSVHLAQTSPATPRPGPIAIEAVAVPLNPDDPSQRAAGRFTYAGGVELRSAGRFGGLSDLEVIDGRRLLAVTDEGDLLEARLVLDAVGRLSGVADGRVETLTGLDGLPLRDKSDADAEGLALLPSGDRLVSFERQHRVWRYPSGGAAPVEAPVPDGAADLPLNSGFEALVAFPPGGPGAYLVGSEGGDVWQCGVQTGCRATPLGRRVPDGYGLTALAVSPDGAFVAILARAYDAALGVRAALRIMPRTALDDPEAPIVDEMALLAPLTRDNFEGVSIVSGANGALRIYLLSDNNFSASQKTYLLAFDWRN
jgi:hypothetical protein